MLLQRESVGLGRELPRDRLQIDRSAVRSWPSIIHSIRRELPTQTCALVMVRGHLLEFLYR